MSVQATTWVIEKSQHKGSALLVLIMIANHAHADGTGSYPTIETLARECRLSERQVIRLVQELEESGELLVLRSRGRRSHEYAVVMGDQNREILARLRVENAEINNDPNPDNLSGLKSETKRKGLVETPVEKIPNPDKMSPSTLTTCQGSDETNPDKMSGLTLTNPAIPPHPPIRITIKDSIKREARGDAPALAPEPAARNETSKRNGKARDKDNPPDERAKHPAIVAIREVSKRFPNKILWDVIIEQLGESPDLSRLRETYEAWIGCGNNPLGFKGVLDWYHSGKRDNRVDTGPRIPHVDPDEDCSHCGNERRVRGILETWPCEKCRPADHRRWLKERGRI